MVDMVDKANADFEWWLKGQIKKSQQPPNDMTDCVDCGEPIGEKRKQAIPHAVRCVKRQNIWENRR